MEQEQIFPDSEQEQILSGSEQDVAESIEAPVEEQKTSIPDWELRLQETEKRLRDEYEAKLLELERKNQAKSDRARANTIRRQKELVEQTIPMLKAAGVELEPDTIKGISERIREQEFWQDQPDTTAATEATPNTVTYDTLVNYVVSQGLRPNSIDLTNYVGKDKSDPIGAKFYQEVAAAVNKQKEDAKQAELAARQSAAKKVVGTKNNFGGTATPKQTPGNSGTPESLEQEMIKLLKQSTSDPAQRIKNAQRRNEIENELRSIGRWGAATN